MSGLLWRRRFYCRYSMRCRSQWPRGLRRGSAAARLLRLWVRIPPGAWMSVVCCQRSLRRDHTSRGVLSTVVRRRVWSRNLVNEEALAHWGLSPPKQTNKQTAEVSLTLGSYSLCDNLKLFYLFRDQRVSSTSFWNTCKLTFIFVCQRNCMSHFHKTSETDVLYNSAVSLLYKSSQ